jgi:hypothetical protein
MATRLDVQTDVKTLLGTDASLATAELNTLIQLRYEQLYEHWPWSRRRRDFTVSLVAQTKSTSTTLATVTSGSPTVTFAGTPITSAMGGRQIHLGGEPQYFFIKFDSTSQITLQDGESADVNWPRASGGSKSWDVFQTLYTLPTTADGIVSLAGDFPIDEVDGGRPQLDILDPDRSTTGSHPTHWCYAGVDSSNVREIEVWPIPTAAILLRGQFTREAPTLSDTTKLDIPRSLVTYGTTVDACHLLHAKQGSQETMWENKALFFERKLKELLSDFKFVDLERQSPPRSIGRRRSTLSRLHGTDFEVTHDLELLG